MSCNPQAFFTQPDSTTFSPRTSPASMNNDIVTDLPLVRPLEATIATIQIRSPHRDLDPSPNQDVPAIINIPDSPMSRFPLPRADMRPTLEEVSVPTVEHSTEPPPKPHEVEFVQPSSAVVDNTANLDEQVPAPKQDTEVPASSSAVNVIPLDCGNPEATINAPQAVKRYLTRWPQGEKEPDPVFGNTDLHDFRTMHNNQDDARRRAELAKVLPPHINVSLLHP